MDDFNALAAALGAGIQDVRGCLILSRDGLVLGAHPVGMEGDAKHSWIRFASLGEPERSFVQFGTEIWCYVRRGPYAAFALTGTGVRPGLVIDHMEEVLLAAEESRARHSGLRLGGAEAAQIAPSGLRAPLHPDPRPVEDAPIVRPEPPPPRPVAVSAPGTIVHAEAPETPDSFPERPRPEGGFGDEQPPSSDEVEASVVPETADVESGPTTSSEPELRPGSEGEDEGEEVGPWRPGESTEESTEGPPSQPAPDDEVDRFSLAREFSQLLQEQRGPSDG